MWQVYGDRWDRVFTTVDMPAALGERNVKRGAVQDAALANVSPSQQLAFGDHKYYKTAAIYLSQAQQDFSVVHHSLQLPIHELLPKGRGLCTLDIIVELRQGQRDNAVLMGNMVKPLVETVSSIMHLLLLQNKMFCGALQVMSGVAPNQGKLDFRQAGTAMVEALDKVNEKMSEAGESADDFVDTLSQKMMVS